jgi:hypothetical protein
MLGHEYRFSECYNWVLANLVGIGVSQIEVLGGDPGNIIKGDDVTLLIAKWRFGSECLEVIHTRTIHSTDQIWLGRRIVLSLDVSQRSRGFSCISTASILREPVVVRISGRNAWLIRLSTRSHVNSTRRGVSLVSWIHRLAEVGIGPNSSFSTARKCEEHNDRCESAAWEVDHVERRSGEVLANRVKEC